MAERARKKVFVGKVVSNRMEKTITVAVERRCRHKLYGKFITKTSTFMAHDDKNECGIGDTVRIMETRPLSRRKRWRLVEIVEKAQ
jgi:small subunit ribosomal protein S17